MRQAEGDRERKNPDRPYCLAGFFVLRMILSDLPPPAEASVHMTTRTSRRRETASHPQQVRGRLSRDHAPAAPFPVAPGAQRLRQPASGGQAGADLLPYGI
jgi:hypothetical protein